MQGLIPQCDKAVTNRDAKPAGKAERKNQGHELVSDQKSGHDIPGTK